MHLSAYWSMASKGRTYVQKPKCKSCSLEPHFCAQLTNVVCFLLHRDSIETVEQLAVPYESATMGWCLEIPPRCPKIKVSYRKENRTVLKNVINIIEFCCH